LRGDRLGSIYHDVTQIFDLGSRRRESDEGLGDAGRGDEIADGMAFRRRELPRVPTVLERELRRLHETLRVPVSNLVRAVLEDAVAVADHASENVEARLKTLASSLEQERGRLRRRVRRDPLEGVFAFQAIKLAQAACCAKCTKELRRGEGAHLGLHDEPRPNVPRVFVCDACVPIG
jgi:DNA polymerase III epsilon subunit-like protein